MEQEKFRPGMLLKSKDGSEYVVFKFYLGNNKKCEEPEARFRGKHLGSNFSTIIRLSEKFRPADKVEQELIDDATEYRSKAANAFFEARRRLREVEDREARIVRISELDEAVVSVSDILGCMMKGIDDVIRYTAKDYIKGETVKKDLDKIRKILTQARQITQPLASNKPLSQVQCVDDRFLLEF